MLYGYARVSTKEQNLDRQLIALKEAGVDERFIVTDKQTGKNFSRPGYNSLVSGAMLREGDCLVVASIDRLGRNYDEIQKEWKRITQVLKVDVRVLDMPLLDTRTGGANIDSKFVADLVLQILSYVAAKELEQKHDRQMQAIKACPTDANGKKVSAKKGSKFGRPEIEFPQNWGEVYKAWQDGKITATEAMKRTGLKRTSFYKLAKKSA